jgi:CheY-like chemotaxis protein
MEKILIVEADPMILEIYQKKFSDSGFEVATADSGERVLEIAKKDKPEVILLDLIMPKMDGFEVIRNLRSGEYDPGMKIIILSNLSQREDQERALNLGANGFVTKAEYSPTDLVKEVKRLLGQFKERTRNERRSSNEKGEKVASQSKNKKILLMEDEEIFVEMFGDKLKQEGYEVVSARNGAWGLKEALKDKFDLFIIDMAMPAMNGDEIVEKLKLEEATRDVPIIILSASARDDAAKKVEELGINEFFIKTQVTPTEVARKVDEILEVK